MSLNTGDKVRAGPYTGWKGEVSRVGNPQRVTVVITVFGRSTAIEVQPSEIEPCNDGGTSDPGHWGSAADPDAPVRDPRRAGPGGRASAVSVVEPEEEQPADAIHMPLVPYRTDLDNGAMIVGTCSGMVQSR